MPDARHIAEIDEHRVATGETLESVAAANGMTWEELARFNWGTADPPKVNDLLRRRVGCTRRPSGSQFYVFDDADDPGIILIPKVWREEGLDTDRRHKIYVRKCEVKSVLLTCCRIPGVNFDYDYSFIRPTVAHYISALERAVERYPDATIIIHGHTDRCGPERYNKDLSDRRARSAYAFVTHQSPIWEELYSQEDWGLEAIQEILAFLGHDPGPIDGDMGTLTRGGMRSFLQLPDNARVSNDASFRDSLFLAYMRRVLPSPVAEERFGAPKFMGCGEFNPKDGPNDHELANGGRGEQPGNRVNRRAVFYFFDRPPRNPPCRLGDIRPCKAEMQRGRDPDHPRAYPCDYYDRIASMCGHERLGPVAAGDRSTELIIHLQLIPDDLVIADDRCTLYSTDEADCYTRTLSIQDDRVERGDDYFTLVYRDLDPTLSYSLKIDPGVGRAIYHVFEEIPFEELKQAESENKLAEDDASADPQADPPSDRPSTDEPVVDQFDLTDEEVQRICQTIEDEDLGAEGAETEASS